MSKLKKTIDGFGINWQLSQAFCNVNMHLTENSAENIFTRKTAKIISKMEI